MNAGLVATKLSSQGCSMKQGLLSVMQTLHCTRVPAEGVSGDGNPVHVLLATLYLDAELCLSGGRRYFLHNLHKSLIWISRGLSDAK